MGADSAWEGQGSTEDWGGGGGGGGGEGGEGKVGIERGRKTGRVMIEEGWGGRVGKSGS